MSDPYSGNTVLLLHMEGSNGSAAFVDSSRFPRLITANGTAQISTAQSKWGQGSGYFDGSGYLSLNSLSGFGFGINDYTIEIWILTSTANKVILDTRSFSDFGSFFISSSGYASYWDGSVVRSGTINCTSGAWTHIAWCRSNSVLMIFVNGVLDYSYSNTDNFGTSRTLLVGKDIGTTSANFVGYLQDLRITKGIARYTDTFTPPSRLPDPDPAVCVLGASARLVDLEDGGSYQITGTVDELGVPGRYRVRLFDRISGRLIREIWSAADGTYSFQNLAYRPQGYFVVAYDHGENPHNAAIADLMTPEAMP